MKTQHDTYEQIERESEKLNRLFAVTFGIVTAISCGMAFLMVADGIFHIF